MRDEGVMHGFVILQGANSCEAEVCFVVSIRLHGLVPVQEDERQGICVYSKAEVPLMHYGLLPVGVAEGREGEYIKEGRSGTGTECLPRTRSRISSYLCWERVGLVSQGASRNWRRDHAFCCTVPFLV